MSTSRPLRLEGSKLSFEPLSALEGLKDRIPLGRRAEVAVDEWGRGIADTTMPRTCKTVHLEAARTTLGNLQGYAQDATHVRSHDAATAARAEVDFSDREGTHPDVEGIVARAEAAGIAVEELLGTLEPWSHCPDSGQRQQCLAELLGSCPYVEPLVLATGALHQAGRELMTVYSYTTPPEGA